MELFFSGHDYKYAAEQMLLTMFPTERPVYPDQKTDHDRAELVCEYGQMICRLFRNGCEFDAQVPIGDWDTERERGRKEQRALKLAFYRAALASGVPHPVWGALTGVKPGKLMAQYLQSGRTAEDFASDLDVSPERAVLCETTTRVALAAKESLSDCDIGLYVGIPFCPTRCAYCSFISSAVGANQKLISPYVDALIKEICITGEQVRRLGQRPVTLYFGGGTPTSLNADQLDRISAALEENFDFSALREYTVEAGRPDTITPEKMAVLQAHGVTRVSVNPQTMSDDVLEAIGRKHTAQDVLDALSIVRNSGTFAVNMDLIAGLPLDTEAGFDRTLDIVLGLGPENITVHTLAIKNGSALALKGQPLPDASAVGRMVERSMERLDQAGYTPYYLYRQKYMSGGFENVGWAKPGYVNLYNILMMEELCPVIAMGAGGSTKLTGSDGSVLRHVNPKYPKEYIERIIGSVSSNEENDKGG